MNPNTSPIVVNSSTHREVVITGLGVVASNGTGLEKFWHNAITGVSGLKPYNWGQRFGLKSLVIGQVTDFHPAQYHLPTRVIDGYGKYLQFALAAAEMAIQDAQLAVDKIDPMRFGVLVASAIADAALMEKNCLILTDDGNSPPSPAWSQSRFFKNLDYGIAANTIARQYGASGPVASLSTGCTAGLDAIGFALEQIRNGKADVMIAGASDAPLCPLSIGSFEAIGALSTRICQDPTQASCPYSDDRDGFVIAEGAGILVLEDYEHAIKRNAKIYAKCSGHASVNNAYHMTDLPPDGEELARCIRHALKDANCIPQDIDYISGHGSSTPQNDENETNAIKRVFGERAYQIPVNSLKSMTGHALAAASAIEMVGLCMEIKNKMLYPTTNYWKPNKNCDLDYVPNVARKMQIHNAIKLASGFSGIHSAVIMQAV